MIKKIFYTLLILILLTLGFFIVKSGSYSAFIEFAENKTFDIRQNIQVNSGMRKHNEDIVIIAIDDASYEYILDKYGEWPLRRDIYAKLVDYIELQNPKSIAFDLMFVKSMKSDNKADEALINIFKKYNNVYTAMNLDNQPVDLRTPPSLPDKLTVYAPKDTHVMEYSNCRAILDGILNATRNIGMINVSRSDDGVLRTMPLYLKYQEKFYPQLGFLVGTNYTGTYKDIKVYDDGFGESVILNWYGPAGTFTNIPIYKLIKASEGTGKLDYDFKDKVIYFGATAASLFDIKTVPVDKVYPGVEVQATYVNNIIDGSNIVRVSPGINTILAITLAILTFICVLSIRYMPAAFGISMLVYLLYIISTYYIMAYKNLWLDIISPITIGLFAFIAAVIIKYLIKSRDFDEQYKLATTDGLTELYNHRYFQEQIRMACENAKRYDSIFSLIILDIDYFKQFNDNYGHQSGDAVLKQISALLKKNVRTTDIVCRYGGEEISIILPNTNSDVALKIAQKLCSLIAEKKFKLANNKESNVTISLGVSTYGEQDGITPEKIIESADKRLYNAKNNGRNRVN